MDHYDWGCKKILIVEDEETNFLFIEAILEDTKAKIIWAVSGLDAIKKFNQHNDIDLILMDIKMPEMDGLTATKKIREIDPHVPIIAQTAYAMSEDKTKCLQAGCNDYLTKPINHRLLLSTINKYFTPSEQLVSGK